MDLSRVLTPGKESLETIVVSLHGGSVSFAVWPLTGASDADRELRFVINRILRLSDVARSIERVTVQKGTKGNAQLSGTRFTTLREQTSLSDALKSEGEKLSALEKAYSRPCACPKDVHEASGDELVSWLKTAFLEGRFPTIPSPSMRTSVVGEGAAQDLMKDIISSGKSGLSNVGVRGLEQSPNKGVVFIPPLEGRRPGQLALAALREVILLSEGSPTFEDDGYLFDVSHFGVDEKTEVGAAITACVLECRDWITSRASHYLSKKPTCGRSDCVRLSAVKGSKAVSSATDKRRGALSDVRARQREVAAAKLVVEQWATLLASSPKIGEETRMVAVPEVVTDYQGKYDPKSRRFMAETGMELVPLMEVVAPRPQVEVELMCSAKLWDHGLDSLFVTRLGGKATPDWWFPPKGAVAADGKPRPLSHDAVTAYKQWRQRAEGGGKPPREAVAWVYYIDSWNQTQKPGGRIPLPSGISVGVARKVRGPPPPSRQRPATPPPLGEETQKLILAAAEALKSLPEALKAKDLVSSLKKEVEQLHEVVRDLQARVRVEKLQDEDVQEHVLEGKTYSSAPEETTVEFVERYAPRHDDGSLKASFYFFYDGKAHLRPLDYKELEYLVEGIDPVERPPDREQEESPVDTQSEQSRPSSPQPSEDLPADPVGESPGPKGSYPCYMCGEEIPYTEPLGEHFVKCPKFKGKGKSTEGDVTPPQPSPGKSTGVPVKGYRKPTPGPPTVWGAPQAEKPAEVPKPQKGKGAAAGGSVKTFACSASAGHDSSVKHGPAGCLGDKAIPCAPGKCPCPHCQWTEVTPKGTEKPLSPSPDPPKGGKPVKPALKSGSPGPSKAGKKVRVDPLEKENPLKAKGVKAPKAPVPAEVAEVLRKHFQLPVPLPKEEWDPLDAVSRKKEQAKRRIPKWALEAVRRDVKNLSRILSGDLTQESLRRAAESATPATHAKRDAEEAWKALKKKFEGVPLLVSPSSRREKNFVKEFDSLVQKYGKQPCFPNKRRSESSPRRGSPERGQTGRRDVSRGRSPAPANGLAAQLSEAFSVFREFAEVSKAFRS